MIVKSLTILKKEINAYILHPRPISKQRAHVGANTYLLLATFKLCMQQTTHESQWPDQLKQQESTN